MLRCSHYYGPLACLYFVAHIIISKLLLENCMLAIFISNYSNIYWKLTKDISADEDLEVEVEKPAEPIKSAVTLRLLDMGSSPHTVGSKDVKTPAESIQRGNTFSTSLKNINFMPGQVRTLSKRALTTRPTSPTFKLSGIIMASKAINKFKIGRAHV